MSGPLFLQIESPEGLEAVVGERSFEVVGRTRVDAAVSVDDALVAPDIQGRFRQLLTLQTGVNLIEVVASLASGEQKGLVVTLVYLPN